MSDLEGATTRYRLTVGIESVEIVNGIEQTPETISTVEAKDEQFNRFEDAKAAQIRVAGIKPEVIEYESEQYEHGS